MYVCGKKKILKEKFAKSKISYYNIPGFFYTKLNILKLTNGLFQNISTSVAGKFLKTIGDR